MALKSKFLKLVIIIAFLWIFIVLLINIFNTEQSNHYIHVEEKLQEQLRSLNLTTGSSSKANDIGGVKEPKDEDLVPLIKKKLPNLPFDYFNHNKFKGLKKSKNCAVYPALHTLKFYNTYWQTFNFQNITFHLYGAYYDERAAVINGPVIRILAMSNHQELEFPTLYCQLWFEDDNKPVITKIVKSELIWGRKWGLVPGLFIPYLLTCELPKNFYTTGDPTPKVVNIVKYACDTASNSLKIIYDKPQASEKQQEFAVCVKGLDFLYEDISLRLIEWLELLQILGVRKVYFYRLTLHPNVDKVLNHYQDKGFIEIQNISMVGGVVGIPEFDHWLIQGYKFNKRLNELIPYNDCFYRNMYKYKHIALLDIDEVIIPQGELKYWQQLISAAKSLEQQNNCTQGFASICAPHVYFLNSNHSYNKNPHYLYMLNHPYRSKNYKSRGYNTKCLHNTQRVLTLHNHYPLSWLTGCKPLLLTNNITQLHHYRQIGHSKKSEHLIWDDNMERYRRPLEERCRKVLRILKLLI